MPQHALAAQTVEPYFSEQTLFARQTHEGHDLQYRIPNLLVSRAGTVFAFAKESVDGIADETKSNFVLRRSLDGGLTWEPRTVMFADPNPRIRYSYSAGVADMETGRVIVFYNLGIVILPEDVGGIVPEKWIVEHPEKARELRRTLAPDVEPGLHMIWTDDDGATWSKPRALGDSLHVTNPVTGEKRSFSPQFVGTQLRYGPKRGRLVVPGRGWAKAGMFDLFAYCHNYVAYSDDHGATWQAGGLTQTGTGEACLVELTDGTLYVNSRNESLRGRGYRAWDRSRDGGDTFLDSGIDLQLPEPHCQASMVRYSGPPAGRSRILFCNPAVTSTTRSYVDNAGRRNLTVRVSYDECRTWPVSRTVCAGMAGYSGIAVMPDGTILCAYETLTMRGNDGNVILARFNLPWLLQGQPEPE